MWQSSKCSQTIPQGGYTKRCAVCSNIKSRWKDLLYSYNRSASTTGVESSTGGSSAVLIKSLKDVLSRSVGGDWSEIHNEAKALVCHTSYAGEENPKAILLIICALDHGIRVV